MRRSFLLHMGQHSLVPWKSLLGFGLLSLTFGLVILLYPEILVLIAATMFFFIGFTCILFALSLRRAHRKEPILFE